jgi:hypothetical protein
MIRKKLLGSVAAASLGIAVYTSLGAATILPHMPSLPTQTEKGVISYFTTKTESFFDYFEDQHARKRAVLATPAEATFQGPYSLMVSGNDGANSFGMILASLGLMAVIVHRRRNI